MRDLLEATSISDNDAENVVTKRNELCTFSTTLT